MPPSALSAGDGASGSERGDSAGTSCVGIGSGETRYGRQLCGRTRQGLTFGSGSGKRPSTGGDTETETFPRTRCLAAGGRADHWGPIVHMGASPHDREAVGVVGSRAHVVEGQRRSKAWNTLTGRQCRPVPRVAITWPGYCHRNHTHTRCRFVRHAQKRQRQEAVHGRRPGNGNLSAHKVPCRRWSGGPLGSHRPHGCESPRPRSGGGRGESCTCGRGANQTVRHPQKRGGGHSMCPPPRKRPHGT